MPSLRYRRWPLDKLTQRLATVLQCRLGQFSALLLFVLLWAALWSVFVRALTDAQGWSIVSLSLLFAIACSWLWLRTRGFRKLLGGLALAIPVIPLAFLFSPEVMALWRPANESISGTVFERTPPIVMVVFDELDLTGALPELGAKSRAVPVTDLWR